MAEKKKTKNTSTTKKKTTAKKKKSLAKKKKTPIKKEAEKSAPNNTEQEEVMQNEVVDMFDESPEVNTDFFEVADAAVDPVIEQPKKRTGDMNEDNSGDHKDHKRRGKRCKCRPGFHIGRFFLGLTLISGGFVMWLTASGWFDSLGLTINLWQWWPLLVVLTGLSVLPARGWVSRTVAVFTIVLVVIWGVWVFLLGQVDDAPDFDGVEIEITLADVSEDANVDEETRDEMMQAEDDTDGALVDEEEVTEEESPDLYTNSTTYDLVSQDGTAVLVDSAGLETGFVVDNTLDDGTVIPSAAVLSSDESQVAYNYYSSVTGEMTIAVSSIDGTGSQNVLTANPDSGFGGVVLTSLEWVENDSALQYKQFTSVCELYCQSRADMDVEEATYQVDLATGDISEVIEEVEESDE